MTLIPFFVRQLVYNCFINLIQLKMLHWNLFIEGDNLYPSLNPFFVAANQKGASSNFCIHIHSFELIYLEKTSNSYFLSMIRLCKGLSRQSNRKSLFAVQLNENFDICCSCKKDYGDCDNIFD